MIAPPPLRAGDRVAVVAPSSGFDVPRFEAGLAFLRERYDVLVRDDVLARHGFLAGDDARRAEELHHALSAEGVRAVVAARGGYGATRIVHALDFAGLARAPRWIVGFSDVTALHVEAAAAGVRSVHGPMVCSLGDGDAAVRAAWIATLEGGPVAPWTDLEVLAGGRAEGPAFGGNLALLEACAAAGRLRPPRGAVWFLEDCTERPYRVDRMLTALRVGGHLADAAAIVVGGFTDCGPGADGVTVEAVIAERLGGLGVPVVTGAPFGHGAVNRPWIVGAPCRVEALARAGHEASTVGCVRFG